MASPNMVLSKKKSVMDGIIDTRDYPHLKQRHLAGHGPPRKSLALVHRPVIKTPSAIFQWVPCDEEEPGCGKHTTCDAEGTSERSFEPCAEPLDWDHHPQLRDINPEDRHVFRHCKLQEWLSGVCTRQTQEPRERFDKYLIRCYLLANDELNANNSKHLLGYALDMNYLDAWVYRLFHGVTMKLAKYGIAFHPENEQLYLQLLREEVVLLDSCQDPQFRNHLREADRQRRPSNKQEENYIKIVQLSRPTTLGIMLDLERNSWHR